MAREYQTEFVGNNGGIIQFYTERAVGVYKESAPGGVIVDRDGDGRIDFFTTEQLPYRRAVMSKHWTRRVIVASQLWTSQARSWIKDGAREMGLRVPKVELSVGSPAEVERASQIFTEGVKCGKQLFTDFVQELQAGRISIIPLTRTSASVTFRDSRGRPVYVGMVIDDKKFITMRLGEPGFPHPLNETCSKLSASTPECLAVPVGGEQYRSVGVSDPEMLRPLQPLLQQLHADIVKAKESASQMR